jgi:hypothetical protein
VWGQLPAGLSLQGDVISGTPTAGGQYSFTIRATDVLNENVTQRSFTVSINRLVISSTSPLPSAVRGQAYTYQLTAAGVGVVTWALEPGSTLPPGITLSASGLLSGSPTAGGQWYGFGIRATDDAEQLAFQFFNLFVEQPLAIVPGTLDAAVASWSYNGCVQATGGSGTQTFGIIAGSAPPGLTMGFSGCFSGHARETGAFTFSVQVTSGVQQITESVTLRVGTAEQGQWSIDTAAGAPTVTFGGSTQLAQVFTVGTEGDLLAVQLPVSCDSTLNVQIRGVTGSTPNNTTLRTVNIAASRVGSFTGQPFHRQLAFTAPLYVQKGQMLAVVLASEGSCQMHQMPAITEVLNASYPYGDAYLGPAWTALAASRPDLPFHVLLDEGRRLTFMTEGRVNNRDAVVRLHSSNDANMVLFGGGTNATVQLYNPEDVDILNVPGRGFAPQPGMNVARGHHTLTQLSDGVVLAVGGQATNGIGTASVELYNPNTRTWHVVGSLNGPRFGHTATLLSGDRVFIAGGYGATWDDMLATTEIIEYASSSITVSNGPTMSLNRAQHRATALGDEEVLLTGGWGVPAAGGAEIFNAATGQLRPVGMEAPRVKHTATRLPDGTVLVLGGWASNNSSAVTLIELFDPATESFTALGALPSARQDHQTVLLGDGRALLIGGNDNTMNGALRTIDLYEPATNQLVPGADLAVPRDGVAAVELADGTILIANGWGASASAWASAERFDPNRDLTPWGVVSVAYNEQLPNGTSFSVLDGAVPPGLSLDSNGAISGTPSTPGVFRFTVRVTHANGSQSLRRVAIRIFPPF